MKDLFLITILGISLISCHNKKPEAMPETTTVSETEQPQAPQFENNVPSTHLPYKVVNREVVSAPLADGQELKKLRETIDIPSEYSEQQLKEIANVLKHNETFDYFNFEFYLESQPKTGPNYGIVNISPGEVYAKVNYVEPPKEPEKPVKKPYDGCTVYGAWNMMGAKVIAYQKNGRCYMVNYYGGSNYGDPELYYKTTYHGRTAFKNAEDPADMYVINSNGDLDGYYDGDLVTTFGQTTY